MKSLTIQPITLKKANQIIKEFHRHNDVVVGCRYCLAALHEDEIVGVAVVGRPLSRRLDDELTAEITRVCVKDNAPKNTNSFLYGRCWRVWQQMGGKRMITYTLQEESGSSLKAVNWKIIGETGGWEQNKGWTTRESNKQKQMDMFNKDTKRKWKSISNKEKYRWEIYKT